MAATTALQNAIRGSEAVVCSFAQSPLIAVVGTAPSVEGVDKIRTVIFWEIEKWQDAHERTALKSIIRDVTGAMA